LKIELQPVAVRGAQELESAFAAMTKNRAEALVVIEDATLNGNLKSIADLATKHRLPAIGLPEFAEAGALMAYGVNLVEMFQRAAYFTDRILKGAKIADLPVERASKFETILNMKTAKTLGIKFPDSIKIRADRVIE
jgi:putative ABC transport system substrate-binding protein